MTYELKSNTGSVKNYVFSSTAAVGVKKRPPQINTKRKPQPKSKNISAQVKKKSTAKSAVAVKTKAKTAVAVREAKPNVHTVKAVAVIPLPIAIISIAIICTVLFMVMVMSLVRINEYTVINDRLEYDVRQLEKSYKELAFSLDKKNNLKQLENKARELGMVKLDQLNKVYISIENEDRIQVIDNKKSAQDILSGLFEGITKNFKSVVEYIE